MTDKNKIMNRKITILLGGLLMCASMGDNDTIQATVMADEQAQKWIEGKTPKKVIIVPKKIVNIVL